MADEFPNPDEEFDFVYQADYEALRELEGKFFIILSVILLFINAEDINISLYILVFSLYSIIFLLYH